jgi:hypothetical protein
MATGDQRTTEGPVAGYTVFRAAITTNITLRDASARSVLLASARDLGTAGHNNSWRTR